MAKKRAQMVVASVVRARVLQLDHVFAIRGYALPLGRLLPFVSPAHCDQIPYRSLLIAAVSQPWADLGPFYWPQKYPRSALSLAVKSTIRRVASQESPVRTTLLLRLR
jgi:hypothetical protein